MPSPNKCSRSRSRTKRPRRCASASKRLLGADCRGIWISTFHALCARLLRREAPAIGLVARFRRLRFVRSGRRVKQVMRELGIDDKFIPPRPALSRISHAKNRMEGPMRSPKAAWNHRDEQIAKVFQRYLAAPAASNALDFDDLLLKSV